MSSSTRSSGCSASARRANLLNLLQKQHPADLAQIFGALPDTERQAVFALLVERNGQPGDGNRQRARPRNGRRSCWPAGRPRKSPSSLQEMPSDDAAALIDYLPEELSPKSSS